MKKLLYFWLCMLYLVNMATGQNPVWTMPQEYFNGTTLIDLPTNPLTGGYNGQPANFTSNMIADELDSIRFFIVDENVYNGYGQWIGGMYSNGMDATGAQEVCIIPDPSNCNRYYIFSAIKITNPDEKWLPTYSLLDLSTSQLTNYPSGTAQDIITTYNIQSSWGFTGSNYVSTRPGYAATRLQTDGSYRLFMHDGVRTIYKFKITPNGVVYEGISGILPPNNIFDSFHDQLQRAELEVYENANGTFKLAGCYTSLFTNAQVSIQIPMVYCAELDVNGNLLTSGYKSFPYEPMVTSSFPPFTFETGFIHGLEFSPNGNYLYVVHTYNPQAPDFQNPIEYFDLTISSFIPVGIASPSLAQMHDKSQIELHVDGRMYVANQNGLSRLLNPDNPNPANWEWNIIPFIGSNYTWNDELTGQLNLRTYTLPDQIDRMNYLNYLQTAGCCLARLSQTHYQVMSYTYTTNTVEYANLNTFGTSPVINIRDELIIPAGVEVVMNDLELRFAPGAKLIIMQGNNTIKGGRLTLNNCLLTLDMTCNPDNLWKGVEVRGNQPASQLPLTTTQQAVLRCNNTTIEYAENAVLLSEQLSNGGFNMQRNGGVVIAANSVFKNNVCDVRVYRYQNYNPVTQAKKDNSSLFVNCRFITNDFKKHTYTPWHVIIRESNGIAFKGCDFANEESNLSSNIFYWGSGVNGQNSSVKILPLCNNNITCNIVDRNTFTNLQRGISIINVNQVTPSLIDQTDFTNVYRGIYIAGGLSSQVTRNNIQLYEPDYNSALQAYGIYLNQCKGYIVHENYIHGDISNLVPKNTYGIIINASGKNDHEVYRNILMDLRVGLQSQGVNSFEFYWPNPLIQISSGLRWKCNQFRNIYEADISYPSGSVAKDQGFCLPNMNANSPAGNIFSRSTFNPFNEYWLNSGVSSIHYRHHDPSTPSPVGVDPIYYTPSSNLTLQNCINNYYDISKGTCASQLPPTGIYADSEQLISNVRSARLSFNDALVIDGGNTLNLLQIIQSSTHASQLRNQLMQFTPLLSDSVLISYLQKPGIPPGHYQQILLACSPLPSNVLQLLNSSNLPAGIKNQINAAQSGISHVENNRSLVNYRILEKNILLDKLIASYWNDTLVSNPVDSIIYQLETEARPGDEEYLSYLYLYKEDSTKLFQKLQEIETERGSNDNFIKWMQLLWSIRNAEASCKAIVNDESKKQIVEDVAFDSDENQKWYCLFAEDLWTMAFDTLFMEIIEPLNAYSARVGNNKNIQEFEEWSNLLQLLYPNPTRDVLYVNLPAVEEGHEITVQLINLNGQVVMQQRYAYGGLYAWNLEQVPVGMYLVQMSVNGELWMGQKVMVAR